LVVVDVVVYIVVEGIWFEGVVGVVLVATM
jgi:hypothetical protein